VQLTFASYNIHKAVGTDRRRDADRILSVLRELDADVIALQEVDRRLGERASVLPRMALEETHWRPLAVARRPRSLGWHGNTLLIRKEIECIDARALVLPTLEPRGAVCAELTVEGRALRVIGTHLDLSGLRRRAQIGAILAHVAQCEEAMPCIVMGDFNQWGLARGVMRVFGEEWRGLAPGASFPSNRPIARLDRIVASREWECEAQGVHHSALSSVASDHLPVWARLSLPKI